VNNNGTNLGFALNGKFTGPCNVQWLHSLAYESKTH